MIAHLLPFIIMAIAPVCVMLAAAFHRGHGLAAFLTALALILALGSLPGAISNEQLTPLLVFDNYACYYAALILFATLAVAALAFHYFGRAVKQPEEFYALLLTAALGCLVLTGANHFASLFLGIEILSVSLYAMIAYTRARGIAIEAGIKYLVLAAGSSAFLVFGMALVYARLGTLEFPRMAALALANPDGLLVAGLGLMTVGIGFKLAVVPFHMWTPDVYQGAPAPVAAFIAGASKGAVFALLLRFFSLVDIDVLPTVKLTMAIIAVASMIVGNLLALLQNNLKRLLAYSSIAHLGYLLVALLAFGQNALASAAFYLAAYMAAIIGAFAVITMLSRDQTDADAVSDYTGLLWTQPWLAAIFSVILLSLAGFPLTGGFIGKIYLVAAGEESAQWALVTTLVVTSGISLFYYLRVIVAMIRPHAEMDAKRLPAPVFLSVFTLAALAGLLIGMGLYPTPFINIVWNFATHPWQP